MLKYFKFVFLTLFAFTTLCADWDPAYLEMENIQIVENKEFKQLKKKILRELKDSWCSEEKINLLMDFIALTKPKTCVEIGAFTGSSVLPVATTLKFLGEGCIFAVDAWSNKAAIEGLPKNDPNALWWSQVDMDWVHDQFKEMIKKWSLEGFCIEVYSPSKRAVKNIPDDIDFLHLDGNFSEQGSSLDVSLYLPKVQSGGYILLSNFHTCIDGTQTKFDAFCTLFDECEYVCSIEDDNAILFRKN